MHKGRGGHAGRWDRRRSQAWSLSGQVRLFNNTHRQVGGIGKVLAEDWHSSLRCGRLLLYVLTGCTWVMLAVQSAPRCIHPSMTGVWAGHVCEADGFPLAGWYQHPTHWADRTKRLTMLPMFTILIFFFAAVSCMQASLSPSCSRQTVTSSCHSVRSSTSVWWGRTQQLM